MKKAFHLYFLLCIASWCISLVLTTGCANIIPPGGGPRDTLPPVLISALPKDSSLNFTGNRIILDFNEYIDLQNTFENIVVSPLPKNIPLFNFNFRTVSIKIKDTLEPNTTYSINFGNSLRDINEGNVLKNFTYKFSTGNTLDTNAISGKVMMAETGKIDSTLIAVLHRGTADSAVAKERPRYLAKVNAKGEFRFNNLPAEKFALYVIPNEYSKQYDDTTKPFAFADSLVNAGSSLPVSLFAYTLPKKDTIAKTNSNASGKKVKADTTLNVLPNMPAGRQDILTNLELGFSKKLKIFDSSKIILTDTNFRPINTYKIISDTTNNQVNIVTSWLPNTAYLLLINKNAFTDTAGLTFAKDDTIRFATKKTEEYGSVKVRLSNIDLSKNPVLQIVQGDKIYESVPLTQRDWYQKLFPPGDFDLRILYDRNKNGVWDAGKFFGVHRQPETVILLNTKLSVRANWDNEKEIKL